MNWASFFAVHGAYDWVFSAFQSQLSRSPPHWTHRPLTSLWWTRRNAHISPVCNCLTPPLTKWARTPPITSRDRPPPPRPSPLIRLSLSPDHCLMSDDRLIMATSALFAVFNRSITSLRSIDWLIDWLIDWWNVWLINWLIGWLIDWLIDWLFGWSIDWLKRHWILFRDSFCVLCPLNRSFISQSSKSQGVLFCDYWKMEKGTKKWEKMRIFCEIFFSAQQKMQAAFFCFHFFSDIMQITDKKSSKNAETTFVCGRNMIKVVTDAKRSDTASGLTARCHCHDGSTY